MTNPEKILGTDEAWDSGQLGNEEDYIEKIGDADFANDMAIVNDSLGLQPISIRLEKSLIDSFKAIATIHGLGYQTLMRQALKRFAECEMKLIVQQHAEQIRAKISSEPAKSAEKPARQKVKKAA